LYGLTESAGTCFIVAFSDQSLISLYCHRNGKHVEYMIFQPYHSIANLFGFEMNHQMGALDICCGRGKGRWNSPGNQRFKEVVQENLQRYADATTKAEKSKVVESVVTEVHKLGGRFLKQNESSGNWYQIGPHDTRSKVAHAIRDHLVTSSYTKRGLDHEEPTAPKKNNKRAKRAPPSKKKPPQRTLKTTTTTTTTTPRSLRQFSQAMPSLFSQQQNQQAIFPVTGPMNSSQTQWQSQQQRIIQSFPSATTYQRALLTMQNQELYASNGQGRVESSTSIGRSGGQQEVNVLGFPSFLPLPGSLTSLHNVSNQHHLMSTSNDMMQGRVVTASNLTPNSLQDLSSSNLLLAPGFHIRERLRQPAISMVGQNHQEICDQGLERPQSPNPEPLHVQSGHDVSVHPEDARLMLSRQGPFGASKQSWDFADGEEYISEDEYYHNTSPTTKEDFEPNAIFPPE
jgi:hypothetical protein